MAIVRGPAVRKQKVGEVIEAPGGGDLRFEHAQRPRRGVARIGEARQAAFVAPGVEPFERAPVHDGFAARLEGLESRY